MPSFRPKNVKGVKDWADQALAGMVKGAILKIVRDCNFVIVMLLGWFMLFYPDPYFKSEISVFTIYLSDNLLEYTP